MTITNNQLYIIFLVVLIFSLLYGVKTKNYFKETFKSENQTNDFDNRSASMKNYQKTSAGHICESDIDGVYDKKKGPKYRTELGTYKNASNVTSSFINFEDAKDACWDNLKCEAIIENVTKNPPTFRGVTNIMNPLSDEYNTKRFKRHIKLSKDDRNLSGFCKKYAGPSTFGSISKVLIPSAIKVTKANFAKFKLSDLPITKVWTGKYVERKKHSMDYTGDPARDNVRKKIGMKEFTKDEAKNWCTKTQGCEHVSVARAGSKKAGMSLIEAPQYHGNARYNNEYDLISKLFKYEFSIAFWIKIDAPKGGWRNIIHVGNNDTMRCPGIYIHPNSTRLRIHQSTTDKIRYGHLVDTPNLEYRKWTHVAMTLKKDHFKVYYNGKEVASHYWMGHPIFPIESDVYLAYKPYAPDGKFHLSKMVWYPMELTHDLVQTIAYGTFPLRQFDPELSFFPVSGEPTVKFRNQWDISNNDESWGAVTVNNFGNFTFIDGVIQGPRANVVVASIPQSSIPDRNIYTIAYTVGGYVVVKITTNGYIYILDNNSKEGKMSPTTYIKDNPVSLSNIRFLRHSHGSQSVWNGIPFDYGAGFLITGLRGPRNYYSYWKNYRGEVIRPKQKMNSRAKITTKSTFLAASSDGKPAQINITNNSLTITTNHKHGSKIYGEGLSWSIYGGEKLKLSGGYLTKGEATNDPKVHLNTGDRASFVNISGIVIKYYRKPVFKKLKQSLGCYKNDLPNYLGSNQDTRSCAILAMERGDQYIGLSNRGECRSGNKYGTKGESTDCYMKCARNPAESCGGPMENIIYDTSLEPELITLLPIKYRPKRNLTFLCSSGNGVTRVDVMKNGKVLWAGTALSGTKWFSLNNICYHV